MILITFMGNWSLSPFGLFIMIGGYLLIQSVAGATVMETAVLVAPKTLRSTALITRIGFA